MPGPVFFIADAADGPAADIIQQAMLTVIIPALNEEKTLAAVLDRVLALPLRPQVIAVSDGSTDGTNDIIRRYHEKGLITGVICPTNRGKGAAISAGLRYATQPYTVIQDADLEYSPEQFERLFEPVRRKNATVVYGSRNLGHPHVRQNHFTYIGFWLGGKVVTLIGNLLYAVHLTDEATCYKLFPTPLLRRMNLVCRGFDFCPEVTAKALRLGHRIVEVPIDYHPRSIDEGKKIRAWHGLQAVWVLLKYRLLPSRRIFRGSPADPAAAMPRPVLELHATTGPVVPSAARRSIAARASHPTIATTA